MLDLVLTLEQLRNKRCTKTAPITITTTIRIVVTAPNTPTTVEFAQYIVSESTKLVSLLELNDSEQAIQHSVVTADGSDVGASGSNSFVPVVFVDTHLIGLINLLF